MQRTILIKNILRFLAHNAETCTQPGVVDSFCISKTLGLTLPHTKQLLRTMNEMGVIKSNIDTDYSLITSAGIQSLNS